MPIFSAIVVFAFTWFITFLVVLAVRNEPQSDQGVVVPGTPSSAPGNARMRGRVIVTTLVATVIWALIVWVILSGTLTIENIDVINRWFNG